MFKDVPFRRELDQNDLERMKIPPRYWKASFKRLSTTNGDDSLQTMTGKYIENMDAMIKEGAGFVFYGPNGTGKSCGTVVLAKEFRRRGHTVLFMESSNLKRMVIEKEFFDEIERYWDRAKEVDVLVLDDFGKGVMDTTGFGASLFDELIRARNSRKKVTLITSNLPMNKWQRELGLKVSTLHTLKECAIPVVVEGINQREESADRLRSLLNC